MSARTVKTLAIAGIASSVLLSGCMGKFALTKKLYKWNSTVGQDRWVNEIIFVGLAVILPVYGLSLLADGIVFNSIQWWTGDNPVAKAGDQQRVIGEDGSEALLTLQADGSIDVQATAASGERTAFTLVRSGETVAVLGQDGLPLGVTLL